MKAHGDEKVFTNQEVQIDDNYCDELKKNFGDKVSDIIDHLRKCRKMSSSIFMFNSQLTLPLHPFTSQM